MQGQVIKNRSQHTSFIHVFIYAITFACIMFPGSALPSAETTEEAQKTQEAVNAFYNDWVKIQQSSIPELKTWIETHLNKNSEISFEVTAKAPALLDYKFHKTLHIDAQKAEKHLIQWLNIHKNTTMTHDIKRINTHEDNIETEVHYIANGVTVLPNGRHKTIRLKTELEIVCLDTLTTPPINVMKSSCALMASSTPLRALK